MQIVRLQADESAPKDSDCIKIEHAPGGEYSLVGSALLACGDGEQAEPVSIVGGETYETLNQADDAGVAWAAGHCVEQLHVECP